MCKTRILTTKGETVISSCMECRMYYIWHNNLVLNFSELAFGSFQEVVNSLPFDRNALPFPDGDDRIILHTPYDDISFAFDEDEFHSFRSAIDEAIYMNEVYTLMNK
jgi:hypothetical protein